MKLLDAIAKWIGYVPIGELHWAIELGDFRVAEMTKNCDKAIAERAQFELLAKRQAVELRNVREVLARRENRKKRKRKD